MENSSLSYPDYAVEDCIVNHLIDALTHDPTVHILLCVDPSVEITSVAKMLDAGGTTDEAEFNALTEGGKISIEDNMEDYGRQVKCLKLSPFYLYQYLE